MSNINLISATFLEYRRAIILDYHRNFFNIAKWRYFVIFNPITDLADNFLNMVSLRYYRDIVYPYRGHITGEEILVD